MSEKAKIQKLHKEIVGCMSELIATVDENEISDLKNKICENIDELGSKNINCQDKKGKTLLNYVHELDSQNKYRLYNHSLVEIEARIRSYGGKAAEINVEIGAELREPRGRSSVLNVCTCILLSLFIMDCILLFILYMYYNINPIDPYRLLFTNRVTKNITNVVIQQPDVSLSVTPSVQSSVIPKR